MGDTNPQTNIIHDADNNQFAMIIDNENIVTKYRMRDQKTIEFYATYTPKPLRGFGYAQRLVNHALDYAISNDMEIIPTCWYVNKILTERRQSSV